MPTEPQIAANRRNAQLSTGPKTDEGKQAVSQNNFRHGLAGTFQFLRWEQPAAFDHLVAALNTEHNPQTPTEHILVERMAQHEWLRRRAHSLQSICFSESGFVQEEKQFALYLRYQTTHERAFHKCLSELLKLRAERRKAQKHDTIGFEPQKSATAPAAGFEPQKKPKRASEVLFGDVKPAWEFHPATEPRGASHRNRNVSPAVPNQGSSTHTPPSPPLR
jgi:hypothetical protein